MSPQHCPSSVVFLSVMRATRATSGYTVSRAAADFVQPLGNRVGGSFLKPETRAKMVSECLRIVHLLLPTRRSGCSR